MGINVEEAIQDSLRLMCTFSRGKFTWYIGVCFTISLSRYRKSTHTHTNTPLMARFFDDLDAQIDASHDQESILDSCDT